MSDEMEKKPVLDFTGFEEWQEIDVTLARKDGPKVVRGIAHQRAPGLAVTQHHFGHFEVTHVPSGKRVVGPWERMASAKVVLAELAVCFDWSREELGIQEQLDMRS